MTEIAVHPVPGNLSESAHINNDKYLEMYQRSINDRDAFWAEQAESFLDWYGKWDKVQECDYNSASIKWFSGGTLNVSYNCLDRHLESRGDQTAIIWEGDDPGNDKTLTYAELHGEVCRFANVLKQRGVGKGD